MKTLLAIHQADLRVAIEILLREEPVIEIIGIVSTFQALHALAGPVQPDLLIVDLDLPGLEAFDWLQQTGTGACPQIIALVSRRVDPDRVLAAGAIALTRTPLLLNIGSHASHEFSPPFSEPYSKATATCNIDM